MNRNEAKTGYYTALKIAKKYPVGSQLRRSALKLALRYYGYWKRGM